MYFHRSVKAAGLILAAVLLGLLAVQGTYALWSSSASAAPGTVNGADFIVNLLGSPSGQSTSMTMADGSAASLALTTSGSPASELTPSAPIYASVTASNDTDAGGTFNITLAAGEPIIRNEVGSNLAQFMKVSAVTANSSASCSSANNYQELGAAGVTTASIAKGASKVICFKVHLISSTPSTMAGQSANVFVPLTATQVCGVPSGCP
ncbi:hypothetical protein J7E82_17445 [Arthrobacter sp. ISL-30]|nr:hypothetical protein [Arthrobacter sp. ISL-30]